MSAKRKNRHGELGTQITRIPIAPFFFFNEILSLELYIYGKCSNSVGPA